MTNTQKLTVEEADSSFSSLIGEYAWWIRCNEHRILQIEFGDPYLRIQGPWSVEALSDEKTHSAANRRLVLPTGTWSLFIQNGLWTVNALGFTCSRSLSTQEEIDICLSRLDGQKLTSAKIRHQQSILNLEFDFNSDLSIAIGSDLDDDDDQWTLFQRHGPNISYQTNGDIESETSGSLLG